MVHVIVAPVVVTEDVLELMGVRAFTFTQPNVGVGSHLVEVQARYRVREH